MNPKVTQEGLTTTKRGTFYAFVALCPLIKERSKIHTRYSRLRVPCVAAQPQHSSASAKILHKAGASKVQKKRVKKRGEKNKSAKAGKAQCFATYKYRSKISHKTCKGLGVYVSFGLVLLRKRIEYNKIGQQHCYSKINYVLYIFSFIQTRPNLYPLDGKPSIYFTIASRSSANI